MEEARLIISHANSWRGGLPDAWCRALINLKREVHIPTHARADWAWLCNEMGRSIESRPDKSGMQFMEGIDETEVRDMCYAFKRVYCCVFYIAMRVAAKSIRSACEVPAETPSTGDPDAAAVIAQMATAFDPDAYLEATIAVEKAAQATEQAPDVPQASTSHISDENFWGYFYGTIPFPVSDPCPAATQAKADRLTDKLSAFDIATCLPNTVSPDDALTHFWFGGFQQTQEFPEARTLREWSPTTRAN